MDQMNQMPSVPGPNDPSYSRFQNAYSSTGFDMLGVLVSAFSLLHRLVPNVYRCALPHDENRRLI
jgi:hypothetical protein